MPLNRHPRVHWTPALDCVEILTSWIHHGIRNSEALCTTLIINGKENHCMFKAGKKIPPKLTLKRHVNSSLHPRLFQVIYGRKKKLLGRCGESLWLRQGDDERLSMSHRENLLQIIVLRKSCNDQGQCWEAFVWQHHWLVINQLLFGVMSLSGAPAMKTLR